MAHNDMHKNSHAVGSQQMSSRREIRITLEFEGCLLEAAMDYEKCSV
jgi:hypothetical protein